MWFNISGEDQLSTVWFNYFAGKKMDVCVWHRRSEHTRARGCPAHLFSILHWHVVDTAQPTLGGAMPILPAWNNQISLTQRPYAKILMTSHAFPKLKI